MNSSISWIQKREKQVSRINFTTEDFNIFNTKKLVWELGENISQLTPQGDSNISFRVHSTKLNKPFLCSAGASIFFFSYCSPGMLPIAMPKLMLQSPLDIYCNLD
jgi:hypothetical protein